MAKFQSAVKKVIQAKTTLNVLENRLASGIEVDEEDYSIDKLTRTMEGQILVNPEDKQPQRRLSFQSTVKKLFQANTSLVGGLDLQPLHKKVLFPSDGMTSIQKMPISGGDPITEDLAIKIRVYAFGPPDMFSFTSGDWIESSFAFNCTDSSKSWALKVDKKCSKGLVMCVQTYFLKHMLFTRRRTRGCTNFQILMKPDRKTQEDCLAIALSDILWKAGEKQQAVLCLAQNDAILENTDLFRGDGITERIRIFNFKRQDELTFNIKKYLHVFLDDEKGGGATLFLYSLILTRGYDKLSSDMDEKQPSAVLTNGTLHRCIANLMLTGRATPYFHNGIIFEGTEATMARPKTGTLLRSEIGFLIWDGPGTNAEVVGSRLKTPSFPVWLTLCQDNYGVLFNPNKDLMRDYHAENKFDLLYYSDYLDVKSVTTLTIDTRESKHLDELSAPLLEVLIQTKWENASISWKGQDPYV